MGLKKTGLIFFLFVVQFLLNGQILAFQGGVDQEKPLGFIEHKVNRKETVFGISRQYGISEKELKRYNPELYAGELQKGMVLQIPRYPKGHISEDQRSVAFISYRIAPGETRWSIAHKFGISLDSLEVLNPDLPKNSTYLAQGDSLRLPALRDIVAPIPEVSQENNYRIPPGKTLFSLAQELGVVQSDILLINPQITDPANLQEGMLIKLPAKVESETKSEGFAFYEVPAGQTQFSLTRLLGLSWDEIFELNPHLERGLQAGMVLKVPVKNTGEYSVKNNLIVADFNLADSLNTLNRPKIAVLFPFRLDRLNLSDEAQTLERIERNNALKYSLGLYSGLLIAMDSVADIGMSSEVVVYDTRLSEEQLKSVLAKEDWTTVKALIGPLDSKLVASAAAYLEPYGVPVVAPMPLSGNYSYPNLFSTYTNEQSLRDHMLQFMKGQVGNQKLFVLADRNKATAVSQIMATFPQANKIAIKEEDENIYINTDALRARLSNETENWIFVETDDFKIASSVSSILNSINSEETPVRMFTTYKGRAFENEVISAVHLSNLRFTYPSPYKRASESGFTRRYKEKFGGEPNRYAVRGFDLGMDLLLRIGYKSNLFEVSDTIGATRYTGNTFNYFKVTNAGYLNLASYILMYDQLQIIELESP
jgi:LysM repeat protein